MDAAASSSTLASALDGGFADPARDAARAFRAALEAMARPGTIHTVTGARAPAPLSVAAATLLLTLCDGDTPLFLGRTHATPQVRDWVRFHTGAPMAGPDACAFALGRWSDLLPLAPYPVGTADYPDRSATLIVEMDRLDAEGTTLTGPGIADSVTLSLPGPELLDRPPYPLGLDAYLACGDRLAAVPRTARAWPGAA